MTTTFALPGPQPTSSAKPKQIKRFFSDEAWEKLVLDALQQGMSRAEILGYRYDIKAKKAGYVQGAALIQRETLKRLRVANPEFDQTFSQLAQQNQKSRQAEALGLSRERRINRTHCKRGHPQTPENTKVYREGKWLSRHCLLCKAIKEHKGGRPVPPELEDKVMQMLRDGYAARAITHGFVGNEKKFKVLIKPERLNRHLEAHPVFASQFNALATKNREASRLRGAAKSSQFWAAKRALLPPKAPRIILVRSPLHVLNEPGVDVMMAVRAAIPAYLHGDIRDEVEASMLLAL